MDLSKLRLLIAQAKEGPEPTYTVSRSVDGATVVVTRPAHREPLLARALEAALDVVEAAEICNQKADDAIPGLHTFEGITRELSPALARFREALEP